MHMNQCIRRLLSNTCRTYPNRRAVSTSAVPLKGAPKQEQDKNPEEGKKKNLQKYKLKFQSSLKVRSSFLPTFPPPLRSFIRDQDEKALQEIYEMFAFLLRNHAALDYALPTRPDGYLSVSKLLNYPLFRNMDIFKLQDIANRGKKFHIHIKFDPRRQDGPWWIRCQKFQEEHYVLQPALLSNANGTAVYRASLQDWESYISRTGIARLNHEYIRLDPFVPNSSYIDTLEDESEVFIFLDVHLCILHGLRFFYRLHSSQKRTSSSALLTKGDTLGIIAPSLFTHVMLVEAKKKHVWGLEPSRAQKHWATEPDDLDEYGARKTYLPLPPRKLHAFVDFYDESDLENRPVHPETVKEAMEVINVDQ